MIVIFNVRTQSTLLYFLTNSNPCFICFQDSYALCRVFKKNAVCTDVEDQARASGLSFGESSQGFMNEYETMSPDIPIGSGSSPSPCMDEDDKDDAWMQFITDDAWGGSSNPTNFGGDDVSSVVFIN